MFRRSKNEALKERAAGTAELTAALAKDKKFRNELLSGITHGAVARRRAERRLGFAAAVTRMSADPKLRRELAAMAESLSKAWSRVDKKRSHRLRNGLLIGAGAIGAAAAVPQVRAAVAGFVRGRAGASPRVITDSIEVNVPVSTAYNQWTQFEDFPLFMEGVDHVRQLDDTRLHWVATVAGKQVEWDAKILEQHPDRQISWVSEDGRQTRGTVTFEPLGDSRALVRLSMSYRPAGVAEAVGSAAGLDERRVHGDLERFKELVESRRDESGAWRGEISAGARTD